MSMRNVIMVCLQGQSWRLSFDPVNRNSRYGGRQPYSVDHRLFRALLLRAYFMLLIHTLFMMSVAAAVGLCWGARGQRYRRYWCNSREIAHLHLRIVWVEGFLSSLTWLLGPCVCLCVCVCYDCVYICVCVRVWLLLLCVCVCHAQSFPFRAFVNHQHLSHTIDSEQLIDKKQSVSIGWEERRINFFNFLE